MTKILAIKVFIMSLGLLISMVLCIEHLILVVSEAGGCVKVSQGIQLMALGCINCIRQPYTKNNFATKV